MATCSCSWACHHPFWLKPAWPLLDGYVFVDCQRGVWAAMHGMLEAVWHAGSARGVGVQRCNACAMRMSRGVLLAGPEDRYDMRETVRCAQGTHAGC